MKFTATAGALNRGDKIGNRVVRYSTFREYNLGYHVYFEDSETPEPYGRNEPISVERADDGRWYLRNKLTKKFWHPVGSSWNEYRAKGFDDEHTATLFAKEEIVRCPEIENWVEVVFLS